MRELGLFAGIGAFSLGLEQSGLARPVAFVEIDPFCQKVLRKHWPEVPCHDNVLTREFVEGEAEIITAGFPCQDVSLAGRRAGITGSRSGLYREMVRAIRVVRPAITLVENVADLVSGGLGVLLGEMAQDGLHVEWDCISSSDVGAPHGRDRIWIAIADAYKLKWTQRRRETAGWWFWRPSQASQVSHANGERKLQSPRLLGYIRRWVDHAARSRTRWSCDWQTQFETFRRMDDGASNGLDRGGEAAAIRALGNSLTPQISEIIGRAILKSQSQGRL